MIEAERKKEDQRESRLRNCHEEIEKMELETEFGLQRAEAQRNITQTMKRHKEELNRLTL
jgi:hypothetical protein